MRNKIVALLLGLQFLTFPAGATTTYKICGLPDAVAIADTDHFELSRNCGGSYNATGAELANYILNKAPGTSGQIIANQNGKFAALSPAATNTLLGLAPVATSGAYNSLSGIPAFAVVATSGSYADLSNKPPIPAAQVASDWSATSGVSAILNKPTLGSLAALSSINSSNWSGAPQTVATGGTGGATPAAAQANLGLVPGTNIQAYSAELAGVAGLSATGYLQRTGAGTYTAATAVPLSAVSGAGTAAAASTGTSGGTVGLLNGNNTHSGSNAFTGANSFSGVVTSTALAVHNLNSGAARAAQAGAVIQSANADGTPTRVENDAYGAASYFTGVRYDGTNAAPTALLAGDEINGLGGLGWNGSALSAVAGAYRIYAAGAWSTMSNPTSLGLWTTPVGSTTMAQAAAVLPDGAFVSPPTLADTGANTVNAAGLFRNGAPAVTNGNTSIARSLAVTADTGGTTQVPTNIVVTTNDEISGYRSLIVADSTAARTLAASDRGTTIRFTGSSAITVTLPNTLILGFNVEIIQAGTGQITFAAASGAVLNNAHSQTKTYGQHAAVRLLVTQNSDGASANYNLAGDTGS